jgi:hypothetical protein
MESGAPHSMSKNMNVDLLLEQFLTNALELNISFNTLAGQVQNSIESHSDYIAAIKEITWAHVYRKHVLTRNQNFVFGTKDLPKSRSCSSSRMSTNSCIVQL